MKLYEVNQAIEEAFSRLDFDPETGEIGENVDDEVWAELDTLQMERVRILEYVAKIVLNTRAEAAMVKSEEERLKARRGALERKEEQLLHILDRECAGEKTNLGIATFSYRKSEKVEISDSVTAVAWLKENGHEDCYRTPAPEVSKSEVKKLLKTGQKVPGAALVQHNNYSLR